MENENKMIAQLIIENVGKEGGILVGGVFANNDNRLFTIGGVANYVLNRKDFHDVMKEAAKIVGIEAAAELEQAFLKVW